MQIKKLKSQYFETIFRIKNRIGWLVDPICAIKSVLEFQNKIFSITNLFFRKKLMNRQVSGPEWFKCRMYGNLKIKISVICVYLFFEKNIGKVAERT